MAKRPSVTVVMTADDDQLNQSLSQTETKMTGLVNPATMAFAAITAGALAAAAAVKKVVDVLNEWEELAKVQIAAEQQLRAVVLATGEAAGFSAEQLFAYAASLQKVTNFSDEQIIPAMAKLASFVDITGERFLRASETMLNMAVMFGSLDSAAVQLGKALNDPVKGINAMARSGVSFTETEREMIAAMVEANDLIGAQNTILDALANQGMDNLARATADASTQLQNATSDLKELGGELWKNFKEPWVAEALERINGEFGNLETASEEAGVKVEAFSLTLKNHITELEKLGPYLKTAHDWVSKLSTKYEMLAKVLEKVSAPLSKDYQNNIDVVQANRAAARAAEERAKALAKEKKELRDKAQAEEEAMKAQDKALQEFAKNQRKGGIMLPTFEIADGIERGKDAYKAEMDWQKKQQRLQDYLDRDSGFNAAITDFRGLHGRISSAAASRTPEDKQLEQLKKDAEEAKRRFEREQELFISMEASLMELRNKDGAAIVATG